MTKTDTDRLIEAMQLMADHMGKLTATMEMLAERFKDLVERTDEDSAMLERVSAAIVCIHRHMSPEHHDGGGAH